MLEFKIIQELKPNEELLEIIKNYNYTIKNGKIKHLMVTNLQFIEPGFIYKEAITKQELEKLQEDYFVFSNIKISKGEYDNATLTIYNELLKQNFYANGIINCPYIENENIVDNLTLIPKTLAEIL